MVNLEGVSWTWNALLDSTLVPGGLSAERAPHSAEWAPLSQPLPEYRHFTHLWCILGHACLVCGGSATCSRADIPLSALLSAFLSPDGRWIRSPPNQPYPVRVRGPANQSFNVPRPRGRIRDVPAAPLPSRRRRPPGAHGSRQTPNTAAQDTLRYCSRSRFINNGTSSQPLV